MKKIYLYLFVFALFISATFESMGQYSSKKMEISNDTYYGTIEVCQGCEGIKFIAGRTYVGVSDNKIQMAKGKAQGKLLHGIAKLFFKSNKKPYLEATFFGGQYHKQCNEWTEDGEFVMNGSYNKGVKNGKIVNYVFGSKETEDIFDNGDLKSTISFDPESKKSTSKLEILSKVGDKRHTRVTYFGKLNTLTVERQEIWSDGEITAAYYNGAFSNKSLLPAPKVIEKGQYKMNQKVGTWEKVYTNGVKSITEYDHDIVKTEKFVKAGKPFTGEVVFAVYSTKSKKERPYTKIQVKNGVREGNTTYIWNKNTQDIKYNKGRVETTKDFQAFLKGQKINKEYTLKKQCDGRGKGLFLEKVQITDKHTIVYCHYRNEIIRSGAGLGTPSPGKKDGFTMIEVKSNKVNRLKQVFFIQHGEARSFVYYGEMINFVLVFDKLANATKTVSFVEGDEAYVIKKDGSDLYKWGCYDLKLK